MSTNSPMDALTDRSERTVGGAPSEIRIVLRTLSILIVLSAAYVTTEPAVARQQQAAPDSLATQHVRGPLGRDLDSLLTSYEAHGFAGTALIVRHGEVVLLKGYGFADIPRGVRNGPETRFEMNSITKMFTGVSILQLASARKIRLDAPIGQYLGPFPASKSDATVEQLAMHTAGLAVAGTELDGSSRDAFVEAMKAAPMESPPGERYRYTNAGYSLLAAIIEVASGQTFEDYLRHHIFVPAGMRSAVFRPDVPAADTRFARGYVGSPSGPVPGPPNPYTWGAVGAAGVWTTVGDIYRWVVAVERGEVVPRQYRALLFLPPPTPSLEAYGWHVRPATDTSRARIDKGGGSNDFATQLIHFPRDNVTIVWASNNLEQRWRRTLNRALPDLIFTGTTHAPLPR
ncbi:MAG TPA: serine hydrolase domain-containing protein [Gemmatimonadales bacterium]|nr:serine hydrolase domain-containing protein [Gemmatimonadales bacterium]